MERGSKANVEMSPSCPRCGSTNTKFCYYNNYSLTQPRYFCKDCRRYWTKGGSLRNVPVGGGCRKNRRGKSLRLSSTDHHHHHHHHVHSRSLGNYNGGVPNGSTRHSYDHDQKGVSSTSVESSSSPMTDGSHIDLALVYANFLNPQPDSKTGFELPELQQPTDDHRLNPSPDQFLSISNTNLKPSSDQLPEENSGLVGNCLTPLSDNDHLLYYCGLDRSPTQHCTSHDTGNYGLPPLPRDEVATDQEILWPNAHIMDTSHTLQVTQQPVLGPDHNIQDPNPLMFGNWSPFDFPGEDT